MDLRAQARRQCRRPLRPQGAQQRRLLRGIAVLGRGLRLGMGDLHEPACCQHRVSHAANGTGDREHLRAPRAGIGVDCQAPRDPDVALGRARGDPSDGRVDAVARDQQRGDRLDRRDAQHDRPSARANRHHDVLRAGRAQQPHGAWRRLLDRLEQHVGRALGHPVGVLDEDHAPPPARRRALGERDKRTGLVDLDPDLLGRDNRDVRMGARERRRARVAVSAAALGALQRRREGPRRVGPAGPGRPGDEPGVRHRRRIARSGPQHLHGRLLPDDVVPHAHRATSPRPSTDATRARISAWISSTAREASTTSHRR